jgi:hypothetical protein
MPGDKCLRQVGDKLRVLIGEVLGFATIGLQIVEFRPGTIVFTEQLPFAVADRQILPGLSCPGRSTSGSNLGPIPSKLVSETWNP